MNSPGLIFFPIEEGTAQLTPNRTNINALLPSSMYDKLVYYHINIFIICIVCFYLVFFVFFCTIHFIAISGHLSLNHVVFNPFLRHLELHLDLFESCCINFDKALCDIESVHCPLADKRRNYSCWKRFILKGITGCDSILNISNLNLYNCSYPTWPLEGRCTVHTT